MKINQDDKYKAVKLQYRHRENATDCEQLFNNLLQNKQKAIIDGKRQELILPCIYRRIGKLTKACSYSIDILNEGSQSKQNKNQEKNKRRSQIKIKYQHQNYEKYHQKQKIKRIGKTYPIKAFNMSIQEKQKRNTLQLALIPILQQSNKYQITENNQILFKNQNQQINQYHKQIQRDQEIQKNNIVLIYDQIQEYLNQNIKININQVSSNKSVEPEIANQDITIWESQKNIQYNIVIKTVGENQYQDKVTENNNKKCEKIHNQSFHLDKQTLSHTQSIKNSSVNVSRIELRPKIKKKKISFNLKQKQILQSNERSSAMQLMSSLADPYTSKDQIVSNRTQQAKSQNNEVKKQNKIQIKTHIVYKSHPFLSRNSIHNKSQHLKSCNIKNGIDNSSVKRITKKYKEAQQINKTSSEVQKQKLQTNA